MKTKISFIVILTTALGINYANASECVGEDCELSTEVIKEQVSETVDILSPVEYEVKWSESQEVSEDSCEVCQHDYNCPFSTAEECAVWYRKPVHKTTVTPSAPHINSMRLDDIIYAIHYDCSLSANDAVVAPLLERYKMLMRASQACCSEGIIYKLHQKNASEKSIYNFLKDDANRFAVGSRCLVTDNNDIIRRYSNGVTGQMVFDVRNACLCKNRQWFDTLLQPFVDIYERVPEFKNESFDYNYIDDLNREITVSVNQDVQTALELLKSCPE